MASPLLSARVGSVRTSQGDEFRGHTRLANGTAVVANLAQQFVVTVPLSNVASIVFSEDAARPALQEALFGILPETWREQQVGHAEVKGSTRVEGRRFTVRGEGLSIGRESDSLHYVYRAVQGDYEMVARVTTVQHTAPYARAGLVMRDTMSEYSRSVGLTMTPSRGGAFHVRASERLAPQVHAQPDLRPPYWIKLRRRGNEFQGYKSRNGRSWTLVQQAQLPMSHQYYVGLAVASGRSRHLNWTTFDGVRGGTKLRNEDFTPRVELTSGSVISGHPLELQSDDIRFEEGRRVVRVPAASVARVIYQPLSPELAWKSRASREGVWTQGGDFFEGSFQDLSTDKVRVSSVLYGLRTFDLTDEVLSLVLRSGVTTGTTVDVATVDGSLLVGTDPVFLDGELVIQEATLGKIRLPTAAIRELRMK